MDPKRPHVHAPRGTTTLGQPQLPSGNFRTTRIPSCCDHQLEEVITFYPLSGAGCHVQYSTPRVKCDLSRVAVRQLATPNRCQPKGRWREVHASDFANATDLGQLKMLHCKAQRTAATWGRHVQIFRCLIRLLPPPLTMGIIT